MSMHIATGVEPRRSPHAANADVTVILPTIAHPARRDSLFRAIHSIIHQRGLIARPLVVVNGSVFDPAILDELRGDPKIDLLQIELASLPNALRAGREAITTAFFGFLDDDDFLYPSALLARYNALLDNPNYDLAVSRGNYQARGETFTVPDYSHFNPNEPLRSLLHKNWLTSCGGLFRAARITAEYFDPEIAYAEWTAVALKITLTRKVFFLETTEPHFEIADTPHSLSKSQHYPFGLAKSLIRILEMDLPNDVRLALEEKYTRLLQTISNQYRSKGELKQAWTYQLRTISQRKGYKFLPAMAKLILHCALHPIRQSGVTSRK